MTFNWRGVLGKVAKQAPAPADAAPNMAGPVALVADGGGGETIVYWTGESEKQVRLDYASCQRGRMPSHSHFVRLADVRRPHYYLTRPAADALLAELLDVLKGAELTDAVGPVTPRLTAEDGHLEWVVGVREDVVLPPFSSKLWKPGVSVMKAPYQPQEPEI